MCVIGHVFVLVLDSSSLSRARHLRFISSYIHLTIDFFLFIAAGIDTLFT